MDARASVSAHARSYPVVCRWTGPGPSPREGDPRLTFGSCRTWRYGVVMLHPRVARSRCRIRYSAGLALVAFGGRVRVLRWLILPATLRTGFDSDPSFVPPRRGFRDLHSLIWSSTQPRPAFHRDGERVKMRRRLPGLHRTVKRFFARTENRSFPELSRKPHFCITDKPTAGSFLYCRK
jgi:hypothetical protein